MELWKRPSDRGYSCNELARMEDLLVFHDRHLAQPKIVVFEPWRQAKSASSSEDRKSKRNMTWATLFHRHGGGGAAKRLHPLCRQCAGQKLG
jgi:hypothetical protein